MKQKMNDNEKKMKQREKDALDLNGMTILVTGSPGFIGANLAERLLRTMQRGRVVSLDNLNDYYDPALKEYRLRSIEKTAEGSGAEHIFVKGSISDREFVEDVFERYRPEIVVNLAAQAGVRYSLERPDAYLESNVTGFFRILEACRNSDGLKHLVFASSSSVYGDNQSVPFRVEDKCDRPVSLYAATKKSDELFAYTYARLFDIPITALRFFTVYGPAGRPDMFYYSAAEKLRVGETIPLFNYGRCKRDFTYVDDVTEGIRRVMKGAPKRGEEVPFEIYNIGKGSPEDLMDFVRILKEELIRADVLPEDFDLPVHLEYTGMQPGDMEVTFADTSALERDYGYKAHTDLRTGLGRFARWYREYTTGK